MAYYELWSILWVWRREFTAREFKSTFPSPSPDKVLHDMTGKGLLERTGWGRYKVNSPKEYLEKKFNVREAYELVKRAGMYYAFTGPDAVFFWTKGGYNVDRFFAFYPIHLKVNRHELRAWRSFFKSKGKKTCVNGEPLKETLFGSFYIVYPEQRFRAESIEGFNVVPLDETVEFCEKKIYAYEPALEILNELYGLGLRIKYKEMETNI